ncbi:hypothetical protein QQP08_013491 [Theobroma cacao]|nr:hypothetical protein QQP08_013491 [Theobroma cacao]
MKSRVVSSLGGRLICQQKNEKNAMKEKDREEKFESSISLSFCLHLLFLSSEATVQIIVMAIFIAVILLFIGVGMLVVIHEEPSGEDCGTLELRGRQSREGRDNQTNDARIEVRDNQMREGSNVTDRGDESRENQTNLVGTHLSFALETTTITL